MRCGPRARPAGHLVTLYIYIQVARLAAAAAALDDSCVPIMLSKSLAGGISAVRFSTALGDPPQK